MGMRITIQVTCDTVQDAQDALARLGRTHKTWDEQIDSGKVPAQSGTLTSAHEVTNARVEKIMGAPSERANISPGEPAIGKIGKDTQDALINALKTGVAPDKPQKWVEHYKLLWKRSLVKFDGEEYYL